MTDPSPRNKYGRVIGHSGTTIFRGMITAEEYNAQLQGKNKLRILDIMRKSSEAAQAALKMIKYPLLRLDRRIEPASEEPNDVFIAEFVDNQLFHNPKVNFHKASREGMTFFDFGHSVAEKTYGWTVFQGRELLGLHELGFRKQTSIDKWETEDGKPGITQRVVAVNSTKPISIPREKLIVWTNDQEGDNYEGVSVLRYAFKSWDIADKMGTLLPIGFEKMAIPTPVLGVPSGASTQDENKAIESLKQYRSSENAYIKKPVGWELEAFTLSSPAFDQGLSLLQHYETNILLSVLGQFLMLGTNSNTGSRAVSEDHSKLFLFALEAANKTFQDTLQEQLINQLVDLNFSDLPNGYPKIKSSALKEDDITQIGDVVQKLKSASLLTPTYETEQHLRSMLKFPELPEDYEADYEKKREMSLTMPEPQPNDPNAPQQKPPADKPVEKKPTKAHILANAKAVRNQLLGSLMEG